MFHVIQLVISLLIGLALSLYGLIHNSTHCPGASHLYTLRQSLPALSSVLIFLLSSILPSGKIKVNRKFPRSAIFPVRKIPAFRKIALIPAPGS